MLADRRAAPRSRSAVYFNKYIDGQPYLCEALELSTSGMLVRRVHEPDAPRACYAVELALVDVRGSGAASGPSPQTPVEGDRLWLCASSVWSDGELEALRFVAQSDDDRRRMERLIAATSAAA
jgi:hypothetical protein